MKTKNLLKKAFLLLALMGGANSAWGAEASLDALSGTTTFNKKYEWGSNFAKNVVQYNKDNTIMVWSNGSALNVDSNGFINSDSGLALGNSSKKSAFVFKISSASDISIEIARNNSDMTASLYYLGETAEVLTDPNNMTPTGELSSVEISTSSTPQTLAKSGCSAGYYMVFGTLRFIVKSITITASANPPGAISFSPAAGSVAAGASVTLASSGTTTIQYQWGASAIGEGGDWSGAVTYSGETKPVVPAAGSANTVLSVKATNANGSTYGSAAYTPVKMALKTIYSFADGIGSQEVEAADAEIKGTTEMKLANTSGRIKLTAATGSQFKSGDAIEFSGSVGNTSKAYGIKYGPNTSIDKGNLYVAAGQPCHVSGTLTLDAATGDLYIGRYDGTTTNFTTFTIRQLTAATSETFTGVKIGGSAATVDEDYTIDESTITLTGTYTAAPNVVLVNHIVFADESTEDQNLIVAFGNPDGEFFTGTATIDGTTYTIKAPCGQINALKVEYKDGGTTVKEEHIDVTGLKVGASYTVPFRMYVEKDGALYKTTKNTDPYYSDVVTLQYNTTVTKSVSSVDLGGGTLVLLEDLDDSGDNGASTRASNCSAYINKGYTSASNLPAGKYNFIFRVENINDRGSYIKVGDTEVYQTNSLAKGVWNDVEVNDVIIPTAGALTLAKSGSAYDGYDILIAIRTGDAVVNITPANNWSTYVTSYALDFSDVEGLKAYVATNAAAGSVTLSEVGSVPAGTPLMLVGTASTEYTVPVVASASAPAKNMFVAGDGTTVFNGSTFDYILYTDGKFYQIGSGTVATNKAYLHCDSDPIAVGDSARGLRISFGDITGVDNVEAAAEAKAQDGKFIENGKLVIVKNGQKYNAAGQQVK